LEGATLVSHDSETKSDSGNCLSPGCYTRPIIYTVPFKQLEALAEISDTCSQYFEVISIIAYNRELKTFINILYFLSFLKSMNAESLRLSIMECSTFTGKIELGSQVITGLVQILLDIHANADLMGPVSTRTFAATVTPPQILINWTRVISHPYKKK